MCRAQTVADRPLLEEHAPTVCTIPSAVLYVDDRQPSLVGCPITFDRPVQRHKRRQYITRDFYLSLPSTAQRYATRAAVSYQRHADESFRQSSSLLPQILMSKISVFDDRSRRFRNVTPLHYVPRKRGQDRSWYLSTNPNRVLCWQDLARHCIWKHSFPL